MYYIYHTPAVATQGQVCSTRPHYDSVATITVAAVLAIAYILTVPILVAVIVSLVCKIRKLQGVETNKYVI